MSFDTFNKSKDEEVKKNFQETLNSQPEKKSISIDQFKKLTPDKEEKKRSVTFSITESQLEKIDREARERGFKNRSELLASFIDAL